MHCACNIDFSLRSEEDWGRVACWNFHVFISDLKISSQSRIWATGFRFPYSLVAVAVWRGGSIKRVVESISAGSGYARHCVKWVLYNLSLWSFNSLNEEHDSLIMLNITRHKIYRNVVPVLTSQVFLDKSRDRQAEIVLLGTAKSWSKKFWKWRTLHQHSQSLSCMTRSVLLGILSRRQTMNLLNITIVLCLTIKKNLISLLNELCFA